MTRITTTGKVFTEKQLIALLNKGAKGTVTAIAERTKKVMQEYTKKNLYDVPKLTIGNVSPGEYYTRSWNLFYSIDKEDTEADGDEFFNEVGYQEHYLYEHQAPPEFRVTKRGNLHMVKFGRYTDYRSDYVGDEMLENDWLEEGTEGGLAPREGTHVVRDTMNILTQYFASNGVQADLEANFGGGITVTREK